MPLGINMWALKVEAKEVLKSKGCQFGFHNGASRA